MQFLPDEILLLIVRCLVIPYVTRSCDTEEYRKIKQTLWSLSLSSRKLRALAQPRLYRAFIKNSPSTPGVEDTSRQDDRIQTCSPLEGFIRTLIARPDLANQVECLRLERFCVYEEEEDEEAEELNTLDDTNGTVNGDQDNKTSPDLALTRSFIAAIMEIPDPAPVKCGPRGITQWVEWEESLKRGSESAQIALLLTLVPALRYLHLEPSGEDLGLAQDLCDKLLGLDSFDNHTARPRWSNADHPRFPQLLDSRPIFNQLQYLTIRSPSLKTDRVRLENCIGLLTLPTLRSFAGYGLRDEQGYDNDEEFYRLPLSHIHQLRFEDCLIATSSIRVIVESCTNLRSLNAAFSQSNHGDEHPDYELDLGDEFVEALSALDGSLERLSLTVPQGWWSLTVASPFDIHNLGKLRVLDVDVSVASLGYDTPESLLHYLPRSLDYFSIRVCDDRVVPLINEFVTSSGEFTRLKAFGIGVIDDDDGDWRCEELRDTLRDLTAKPTVSDMVLKTWLEPQPPNHLLSLLEEGDSWESVSLP